MPLGRKLTLLFSAMLVACLALVLNTRMAILSLGDGLRTATRDTGEKILLASQYQRTTDEMLSLERGLIACIVVQDRPATLEYESAYQKAAREAAQSLRALRARLPDGEGLRLLARAETIAQTWAGAHQRYMAKIWAGNDTKDLVLFSRAELVPVMTEVDQVADELLDQQRRLLADSASMADRDIARSRNLAMALSGLCLAVGAGGFFVVRRTTVQLRGVTRELASGADQVAAASRQVSEASQNQAQGASQQAAALEETSSSSHQVSASSQENAASARQAAAATTQVRQSLQEVTKTMAEAIDAMGRINHSSSRISAILKVIDEIAFQTNILALNASVEAARAGESGLGFAVVADEVRNLAQRCAQAARDTSGLVDESLSSAGQGKEKLDVLAASVTSMNTAAGSVQTLAAAVMEGSVMQAKGMEQISRTVHDIQRITQSNAAAAEEGASAGEQLSAQAAQLHSVVESLSIMIGV